jgi:hypothetical protein
MADRWQKKESGQKTEPLWLAELHELRGLGREQQWRDVDPDEYVKSLREGWE